MKKLFILVAIGFVIASCSNHETEEVSSFNNIPSVLKQEYELSKTYTEGHNVMLENTFNALCKNPVKVDGRITSDEKKLDQCISLFLDANKDFIETQNETRASGNVPITFDFLKDAVLSNKVLYPQDNSRATSNEIGGDVAFLELFFDDFFQTESLNIDSLDYQINKSLEKVMLTYPQLSKEEIEGLAIVAGVTYNSCMYWNENADKWAELITGRSTETTRGWLWDGIKNGTKKWAKADSTGAFEAWTISKLGGVASGGQTILAGAAVGSVVGAFENLWG